MALAGALAVVYRGRHPSAMVAERSRPLRQRQALEIMCKPPYQSRWLLKIAFAPLPQITDNPTEVELDAKLSDNGCMKTTIDIPDAVLEEAMVFTKARTKREAIVTAVEEFNRRRRMAALVKHAGTCDGFMSADQVRSLRRKG